MLGIGAKRALNRKSWSNSQRLWTYLISNAWIHKEKSWKQTLNKIESSTHESYMNYYDTQEKIDIINEWRDFETFGYEMVNTI